MRSFAATPWMRKFRLIAFALGAFSFAVATQADDRHRWRDSHEHKRYEQKRHHDVQRHHPRRHDRLHDGKRDYYSYSTHRHAEHRYKHPPEHARSGWHYHGGRYWAPPSYRGQYCSDRRHYHAAHYHVAVRDYYDYYYPRYRYYGPYPHHSVASLIISVPLF